MIIRECLSWHTRKEIERGREGCRWEDRELGRGNGRESYKEREKGIERGMVRNKTSIIAIRDTSKVIKSVDRGLMKHLIE